MNNETTRHLRHLKLIAGMIAGLLCVSVGFQASDYLYRKHRTRFENLWVEHAKDLVHERNWHALLDHSEEWVQQEPDEPYALFYNAQALFNLDRLDESAQVFERVKILSPGWTEGIDNYLAICRKKTEGNTQPHAAPLPSEGAPSEGR